MGNHKERRIGLLFMVVALVASTPAYAQLNPQQKIRMQQALDASKKIPASYQKHMSAGTQNYLHVAAKLLAPPVHDGGPDGGALRLPVKKGVTLNSTTRPQFGMRFGAHTTFDAEHNDFDSDGPIPVSDPSTDFTLSVLGGFVQSETSTAWCGSSVVVGFNDSGSLLETAPIPTIGLSFSGFGFSHNKGRRFTDGGFVNPGPDLANSVLGDPVVTCSSPTNFYYSQIFNTATPPDPVTGFRNPIAAVSVSQSVTGGTTWGNPIAAVAKDGFAHLLDKPWSAVDPSTPGRLYVTYTDFDFSFPATGACANDFRQAVEIVRSDDGGITWGAPTVVDQECGATGNAVTGSQVAVSAEGQVNVALEFFAFDGTRAINFRQSVDGALTFGAEVTVSSVTESGGAGFLEGFFRTNEFPSMAVDRSSGSRHGTIYIAWPDGRDNRQPDALLFSGFYNYADILISKSTDGGQTWSVPTAISPTPPDFAGVGRDQFFPGAAVDKDGEVSVCYYDRRLDPGNTLIDRFCSTSHNGGGTWNDSRKTETSWQPSIGNDGLINPVYMGDYDALTSDFTLHKDGFIGAMEILNNGNPDVWATKY